MQYERAVAIQGDQTALRAEAARRAALSNAQNEGLNASMSPAVEARLQAAFAASGTFNKAVGVLRVQDDLYRQFKIKWSGVLEEEYGQKVDDTVQTPALTPALTLTPALILTPSLSLTPAPALTLTLTLTL